MKRVTENNYFSLDPDVREMAENISFRISEKRKEFGDFSLDPLTIISIANAVVNVINFIYKCYDNNSKSALKKIKNPGFIFRILIRRQIRKYVNRNIEKDLYDSLIEYSQTMSIDDVVKIMMTYKNNKILRGDCDGCC